LVGISIVYLVKLVQMLISGMSRTIIYVHVNLIIDFPIIIQNTSIVCWSIRMCISIKYEIWEFSLCFFKENTYPKRRALLYIYKFVFQT